MLSLLSSGMHLYDAFAISPCLSSRHSLHVCNFAISICLTFGGLRSLSENFDGKHKSL